MKSVLYLFLLLHLCDSQPIRSHAAEQKQNFHAYSFGLGQCGGKFRVGCGVREHLGHTLHLDDECHGAVPAILRGPRHLVWGLAVNVDSTQTRLIHGD